MYQSRQGNLFIYGTNRTIVYNLQNWTETTNNRPVLAPVSNQTINAGITLLITNTATDIDQPAQTLTFGLAAGPTNASIVSNTGVLSWRPLVAQANTTNLFSVFVSDNGNPSLSATQNFVVVVRSLDLPYLSATATNNQVQLTASGDYGPDYTMQASTNLMAWTNLFTSNSPALPFVWVDSNSLFPQRFYRLLLGP
jgi:hypothetical protein